MMSKEMERESYFREIKDILMGVGEDDKDSTAMANSLLDDKDISYKNAFDIAKGYADSIESNSSSDACNLRTEPPIDREDFDPDYDFQVDPEGNLL